MTTTVARWARLLKTDLPENVVMKTYESDSIAVSFDVKRCIHARRCVLNLPAVFQAGAKGDWIIPGNASAAVRNGVLDIQSAKDWPSRYHR